MALRRPVLLVSPVGSDDFSGQLRTLEIPRDALDDIEATLRPRAAPNPPGWDVDPFPSLDGPPAIATKPPALESRAPGASSSAFPSHNRIPSSATGPCTDTLLVFCGDADDFDQRLRELHDHITVRCRNTKKVVLVTSRWDPAVWSRYVETLRACTAVIQPVVVVAE